MLSSNDYRNREYALDTIHFSSFAYLIDATRIFVSSLREATQYENPHKAELLCSDLEASIVGWFVMLPPDKWQLAVQPVFLDQLIFQAHMMMYTYVFLREQWVMLILITQSSGVYTSAVVEPST